jgi:hypothetical protein
MLQIGASHIRDLREAGAADFAFDAPQFKSESLRRYRVLIKDLVSRSEIWLQAKPMRYLDLRVGIRQERSEPTYLYTLEGNAGPYQIAEWRVGMRYAFGERVMQSLHRTISFGTKYPVAWLQIARSVAGRWGSAFTYTKIDFKAQHSRHFLGFGKSALQVRMGKLWGTAPYSLLYNGLGSYRTWAAIARNSFETMGYNEFMSDWHFSAFYTHNFGQLHLRKLHKQPSFEMSHAFGFGGLRNPSSHGFPLKTMEKGYFESGFFMNNLVSVGAFGLSLNVGAGVFARYGAYSFPDFSDNIVYKLAIEVSP